MNVIGRSLHCCAFFALAAWAGTIATFSGADELEEVLRKTRHTWQGNELPIQALTIDLERLKPRTIDAIQAAEDVETLFDLLAHGYSGYGFFSEGNRWHEVENEILADLGQQREWDVADLPDLLRARLAFIRDCHLKIGPLTFASHRDLWFDPRLEVRRSGGAFVFPRAGADWTLTAISSRNPTESLLPSLNREGEDIFRIGILGDTPPEPVTVEASNPSGVIRFEVPLRRSSVDDHSGRAFRRDQVGGIPVYRVRSFSDFNEHDLRDWLDTADEARHAACVIVDVRGNRGGNERWPIEWIRRLTGESAGSLLVTSELHSRTTMAGRANAFASWLEHSPKNAFIRREAGLHRERLERFGPGGARPAWTEPQFPPDTKISCDTTVVVITNGLVGSAGEGFVMRISRLENVVVVGENTRGALTFGNISLHRLPHSGLDVWMPININLFPDGVFREEVGLAPDYWVPTRDALDFAVAALRRGTLPTVRPLPDSWRESGFVGEVRRHTLRRIAVLVIIAFGGCLWAYATRKQRGLLPGAAVVWIAIGSIWIVLGGAKGRLLITDIGFGMAALGLVLAAGRLLSRRQRTRSQRTSTGQSSRNEDSG